MSSSSRASSWGPSMINWLMIRVTTARNPAVPIGRGGIVAPRLQDGVVSQRAAMSPEGDSAWSLDAHPRRPVQNGVCVGGGNDGSGQREESIDQLKVERAGNLTAPAVRIEPEAPIESVIAVGGERFADRQQVQVGLRRSIATF